MGQISRIMIVDDEENVLSSLKRLFRADGYEIVTCASPFEALEIIKADKPFQIIISDYRMPEMNGVDFLKEVRNCSPETIRIVLSGYADASAIIEATNEGQIYKFIAKPWNDDELRFNIKSCLERYCLEQKNRELLVELSQSNQDLEEKIYLRTQELELRHQALEFSQNLLGSLPVGVVAIDCNGMIAFGNVVATQLLKGLFSNIFGEYVSECGDESLVALVERVRHEQAASTRMVLDGKPCRVIGHTLEFSQRQTIVLVFVTDE